MRTPLLRQRKKSGENQILTLRTQSSSKLVPCAFRRRINRPEKKEAFDAGENQDIAQPFPGLWLLALDSAKYENNARLKYPETSGAIRTATCQSIERHLQEAAQKGVAVIAGEHHPLMEHFDGMKSKYPEYVLDDNWKIARLLAAYNVRMIFSGHYHASSIVMHRWDQRAPTMLQGKHIVDAETGSLVTWPCSYRTVHVFNDGRTTITTSRVDQLPSYAAAGRSFDRDGKLIIEDGIANIASATMRKYLVPQRDIDVLTPEIVQAMMAHYAGDAQFTGGEMITKKGLSVMGGLVVSAYDSKLGSSSAVVMGSAIDIAFAAPVILFEAVVGLWLLLAGIDVQPQEPVFFAKAQGKPRK